MEEKILQAIDEERLLDTAGALIEIPSPTLSAGAAADKLAEILAAILHHTLQPSGVP